MTENKQNSATNSRGGFGSRLGFILAAAGSAVGLGNIWRFPYLAAKYGGGIFLLVYLVFAVTFGFSLMITEIAIGRKTRKSVIGAYRDVSGKFSALGWFAMIIPAIVMSYYCVIGGWVLKYAVMFITGASADTVSASDELSFFEKFIGQTEGPVIYFIVYVLLTSGAVMLGVEKGIEKISKILMPVFFVLIIGIAVYTFTLDGVEEGLKYYFLPNFKDFTAAKFFKTIAAAIGQLFYSMSIAMGILVTYGSYMRKEDSLETSVRQIEIFDTLVAFIAGAIIVPSVFVFSGGNSEALNAGPSLMFITLPKVFEAMPAGGIIGMAFFILVSLAALTSSISLMETVVAVVIEKFGISRKIASLVVILATVLLGLLSVFGYSIWSEVTVIGMQFLDFFDFITNNLMMPLLAFFTCIMIGWVVKTKYIEDEVMESQKNFRSKNMYRVMIKYICPVCMVIILLTPFITEI